jgi:glutathione synthase/RimK-type ligase-like ATP-grasp enzyme
MATTTTPATTCCCGADVEPPAPAAPKPFGLPVKPGVERFSPVVWKQILAFVQGNRWRWKEPATEADLEDSLTKEAAPYGAFMLGFDFHLTEDGPKLIEINTNAGGLASVLSFACCDTHRKPLEDRFVDSVIGEFRLAQSAKEGTNSDSSTAVPRAVAIMDDNLEQQALLTEMKYFARLLTDRGVPTFVLSPSDCLLDEAENDGHLVYTQPNGEKAVIDVIYLRLTDFRLQEPIHAHLRAALLANKVVVTPHPSAFSRIADKRNLLKLRDAVVPEAHLLSEKTVEEWNTEKKQYVFKPPEGNGSRGVFRGDKVSLKTLQTLPPNTIVQRLCPPATSEDGSKYDLRVITWNSTILGVCTRHFTGQVMEMKSEKSGFRRALPEGLCCLTRLIREAEAEAGAEAGAGAEAEAAKVASSVSVVEEAAASASNS